MDSKEWAKKEFEMVDLGDERLNQRLVKISQQLKGQNKKVVTIAVREADIYDMFLLADRINTNVLIRASHNRKINKTAIHSEIFPLLLLKKLLKKQGGIVFDGE